MCLRALRRFPESLDAVLDEVALARGANSRLDHYAALLVDEARAAASGVDARARRVTEMMALAIQGSLLTRFAPPAIADAFCSTRFGSDRTGVYGTLPDGTDVRAILDRAWVGAA
jgi:putative acyl-CoA dehydrogenase